MNVISNAVDALEEHFSFLTREQGLGREWSPQSPTAVPINPLLSPVIIITTAISSNQSKVLIRIADNGPGMTEAVKKHIFDPFFTTKPVGKGTGLGLAISYQIVVDKHNGAMRCVSEPGQGTEFLIEIPIK